MIAASTTHASTHLPTGHRSRRMIARRTAATHIASGMRARDGCDCQPLTMWLAAVCSDTPLMRLTRDERKELVGELAQSGMSSRAIAPVVGASAATIKRDIAGGSNEPPIEPAEPPAPSFDPVPAWDVSAVDAEPPHAPQVTQNLTAAPAGAMNL